MKALITGFAGFIGSNLMKRLLIEGWDVVGVDDLSSGYTKLVDDVIDEIGDVSITKKLEALYLDFADERILSRIESGDFDVIFHQAAVPRVSYSVENPSKTTGINVNKTVKLMEAATKADKMPRFVFASSSSVYGGADKMPTPETEPKKPVSPYALQKSVIEEYCHLFHKLYGLESVCLRYFNVFGPRQFGDSPYSTAISAWCHAIKHGVALRSDGDGEQSRDLCYVDNVVDANLIVATYRKHFSGECFNVACGDRTSNNEILDFFKKKYPDIIVENAPERAGDVKHTQADITKLCNLGYEPKARFWDGLEKTLKWWNI